MDIPQGGWNSFVKVLIENADIGVEFQATGVSGSVAGIGFDFPDRISNDLATISLNGGSVSAGAFVPLVVHFNTDKVPFLPG